MPLTQLSRAHVPGCLDDWRRRYVQRLGGRDQDSGLCVWRGWDSGGRWTLVTMVGVGREEKTKG